jgi:hypothetical protein
MAPSRTIPKQVLHDSIDQVAGKHEIKGDGERDSAGDGLACKATRFVHDLNR